MEKVDEDVKTLMSAKRRMSARLVLVVSIRREVTDALTSMNVQMELISVMKMLSVKTPMRDTCVLATMVIQARSLIKSEIFSFFVVGDGATCNDVDECLNSRACQKGYQCLNRPGSFQCVDMNECTNGNHQCDRNARCENTNGSYSCTCKDGFTGKINLRSLIGWNNVI